MLFAAVDYLCYRTQRGRYQTTKVEANGWKLATRDNFGGLRQPRPADILVFHIVGSALSWVVMYVTNSLASHVATMVDGGNMVEVTTSGATRHPLSDSFDGHSYLVAGAPPGITYEQRAKVTETNNSSVGTPYGWYSAVRLGMRNVVGARYTRSHPRLYADVALTLAGGGWVTGRRHLRWQLAPLLVYIGVLSANRFGERERLLQRQREDGATAPRQA